MEINEFRFSDGTKINLETTWNLDAFKQYHIYPQGAAIKTAKIRYYSGASYRGALSGIEFLDRDKNSLLKAGWWEPSGEHTTDIVELEEGERIVSYKSSRRGESYARHYDFQLVIGRLE
jgi:hypothetical protein